jgi:hypothetical protein
MSRITITTRHTGRIYVGLDIESFAALNGLVLFAEGTQKMFRLPPAKPEIVAAQKRVVDAFKQFTSKMKSEKPAT